MFERACQKKELWFYFQQRCVFLHLDNSSSKTVSTLNNYSYIDDIVYTTMGFVYMKQQ